ncbi:ATP-binding cassette domain-containing protein [Microlunatus panaciterrae]|uniref:ATPase subunit of ABC transporter with duplicated ATPase domains n=1 Tax=Microlunatus panaciterrae TaxID=400768 RepID=A0ABS2RPG2_9ACTN|nr:ABC-F family ATP-binding cassette domain-containing protein [Microlunatus panaciterrae]MBM7800377.1 ATPase subunit of ABC transporter with duplicated ATPase domains [Microlunatus panaciterrae]
MHPSLVCHDLTFGWPSGETVFTQLDAVFPAGLTGLVGRNGVGKSTLLKIFAGELSPTSGRLSVPTSIGYLPQNLVLAEELTVADVLGIGEVVAALRRIDAGAGEPADFETVGDEWDVEARSAAVLTRFGFADVDLDRTIGTLSGGEAVLIALAGLFVAGPDLLIMDEPTNNLDVAARERLFEAVASWRGTAIMVSHDRALLELVDSIAELREGSLRFFGGNFSAYTEALAIEQEAAARGVRSAEAEVRRQRRDLIEAQTKLDRRQRFARSQSDNLPKIVANAKRNQAEGSAAKLRGGHEADLAEARQRLEAAEERVRDDDVIRIELDSTLVPPGRDVLILDDVVLRHGVRVSAHLRGPERIGLLGPNGAGKTTLIDTVRGAIQPRSGSVDLRVPHRLLPQRLQVLDDDLTVLAGVSKLAPGADDNTLRAQLARFLLDADMIARPAGSLSGGERFRASLAALLLSEPPPQLLILDEPTNNLDLDSVRQLTAALCAYRGALLVASHDQPFLEDIGLTGQLELGAP